MAQSGAATGRLVLAAVSGLAIGATFSPHGGPVLPFLAFAPLAAALSGTARDAQSPPLAPFALGFAAAVVAHGIGLYWMVPSLSWRTPLAVPTYLLVLLLIGVVAGAACGAALTLHIRRGWPLALALASCWTGFEWLAARVPWVPYAWLNAGSSLAWHPALAAGAEVLGARFLTFWTVSAGALAATVPALLASRGAASRGTGSRPGRRPPLGFFAPGTSESRPPAPRTIALAAILLALPALAGAIRQARLDAAPNTAPAARIAVVQPGRAGGGLDRWLGPLQRQFDARPFDAAAFPERFLAVPGPDLARFANALGTDVLIGALDAQPLADSPDTLWYNAAFVQPPNAPPPPPHRKARLVPGLEATGVWPATGRPLPTDGYAAGNDPRPLNVGGRRAGVLICYDSAFEADARALARAGAEWLAVISNDDWLDPAEPFRTTWAYWQHATHARLRAIENRVSVIQVGATGYSFAVSPAGRGAPHALEPGVEGVAVLPAAPRRGATLFTRTGDLLGLLCFAVLAAGAVGGAMPTRRPRRRAASPSAFTGDGRSATLLG